MRAGLVAVDFEVVSAEVCALAALFARKNVKKRKNGVEMRMVIQYGANLDEIYEKWPFCSNKEMLM
jgi:hypothetical protein